MQCIFFKIRLMKRYKYYKMMLYTFTLIPVMLQCEDELLNFNLTLQIVIGLWQRQCGLYQGELGENGAADRQT
jgi:hypothetical protein